MAFGIVARLAAGAAGKLLPKLRQAGVGLLMNVVEKRAPAAGDMVRQILGGLGLPVPDTVDEGAVAIAAAFDRDPPGVTQVLQQVENGDKEKWIASAEIVDDINRTMRLEAKSQHWLVRSWRPIFALMTAAMTPVFMAMLYHLLLSGNEQASIFGQAISIVLPPMLAVTGVYVWGRSKEKVSGAS